MKDPVFCSGVKTCRSIRFPMFANTGGFDMVAPIVNCLFVVAQEVDHRGMLHEDGLEGRRMTRYMMVTNLSVPGPKKVTEFLFQVRE